MSAAAQLEHLFVFIMAGGSGERFWPLSRARLPKHLLRLLSDRTLLEMTARRFEGLVPWERIFILTNAAQVEAVRAELPFLPAENILAEPEKRDTAPACALAVGYARARDPLAVCALLPADAMIHDTAAFQRQFAFAAHAAREQKSVVTFAIPPVSPSTAFGYLHLGEERNGCCRVLRFVEKPDLPTAASYLRSGEYGWNAGIFIWPAQFFFDEASRVSPLLAEFIRDFPPGDPTAFLVERFPRLPKISVDYAIMEQVSSALAIRAEFDWDDVGSWTSLPGHLGHDDNGNTLRGEVVQSSSKNNIVVSASRLVALCGVENLVVVETPDAVLVCHRDAVQDIKKIQPLLPESLR